MSPPQQSPPPIRLDDLADPQFGAAAQPMVDLLAAHGETVDLRPEALLDAASEQTGLDTWGAPGFRARLDLLCRSCDGEADLSPLGRALTYESLVQVLRNRLLVEDLWARHPEIAAVEIARPIIICGLPRTGTTHLHNLLSADPALRELPYWESLEPVLADHERPGPGEPDPRRARCQAAVDLVDALMPEFTRMHEMTVDHAHEEIQLLALDVSGMFFEATAPMAEWRDHYLATDQGPSYAYLRRILQVLTWLRGGDRWVLKSPQHLEQFGPLVTTFPDATFVVPHRDPVAVTTSVTTMLAYSARMRVDHPDPVRIAAYWADRTATMLDACVRDRDLLPPEQTVHVRFDEFMADELATVERIYAVAEQPLDDRARAAMAEFVARNPRGRHGTVDYDLHALGLDAIDIADRTQRYADTYLR
jgi:hypothetical protein